MTSDSVDDAESGAGGNDSGPSPTDRLVERIRAELQKKDALKEKLAREVERNRALKERLAATAEKLERRTAEANAYRQIARSSGGGDDLQKTDGWSALGRVAAPHVNRNRPVRVLLLNSLAGIMSHLAKGLMLHENIEADCVVANKTPRRSLLRAHETIANGTFSHAEWRSWMQWALGHYDIVHSITLPLDPAIAECYDWVTENLGRRHIWTETGGVHQMIAREDVIPERHFVEDMREDQRPGPSRLVIKSFRIEGDRLLTDPHVVFYSSPEKGVYLKGKDVLFLPCPRDPDVFRPRPPRRRAPGDPVRIFFASHKNAKLKGRTQILDIVERCRAKGVPIELVTSEGGDAVLPELRPMIESGAVDMASMYPVPAHLLPELLHRVDIVIDQIIMGSYGLVGIEAMLSGKPVIGQKRYPEIADAPVIPAEVDTLEDVIADTLQRESEWEAIGRAGRDYAMRLHSTEAVAKVAAGVYRRVLDEPRF